MRLRLRLLILVLSSFWNKPIYSLSESVLNLRVLLNDVDITKITSDRFLALMDLGRLDIVFRAGLLKLLFKKKWVPMATFQTIRFRYPLKVFQKYQLRSRIVWWDETTFYVKHIFERKGRVVATGFVCANFLGSNGPIPPSEVLAETGQSITKPNEPEIVAKLREIESLIHETQKE